MFIQSVAHTPYKLSVAAYMNGDIDENPLNVNEYDLCRYLYQKYNNERVKAREKLRETSYFVFDDQLFYLPVKYHQIHEEEEEKHMSQLELVRTEVKGLLIQFKQLMRQLDIDL
jgi:hypothetical protein